MRLRLKPSCLLYIWLTSATAYGNPPDTGPARPHCNTGAQTSAQDLENKHSISSPAQGTKPQDNTVRIEANQVNYQPDQQLELEGNVEIVRGDYRANSDRATVNQTNEQAELQGNVKLHGPDLILRGDAATMDMINEQMSVSNARFRKPSNGINGEAEQIHRPDPDTLIIKEGVFTTCEPDDRAWSFAASEIKLDQASGFGTATHTKFRILDTPVFYIPWFSFPIDDQRKTGFLYPTIGSSNTESGIFFSTPYYFNLGPQDDATLTPSYIHGRGLHTELEGRHLSSTTLSKLAVGFIEEDRHYAEQQRAILNSENSQRWGLSFEQEINLSSLSPGWHGLLDYSAVSDNDYLDDLNQGLHIDNQNQLDRRAAMQLSQDNLRFSILVQQYKSLDDTLLPEDETFQRLPEINLQFQQRFKALQLDWQSQYVYFYRDDQQLAIDESSYGSRFRHQPTLSAPFYRSWGFLKPSVTLDHTDYLLQGYPPQDNHISRTLPVYAMDAGLFFDRPSALLNSDLAQSLEPRIHYVYTPDKHQDDIPNFDTAIPDFHYQRLFNRYRFTGGDRIGDSNRLSLSMTSRWTDPETGTDRAVFSLGQIHYYEPRRVGLTGTTPSNRSESLFASELQLRPFQGVDIAASGLWDSRENTTREGNSRVRFHSENYQSIVNLSHRYIRAELEQFDSSVIFPVTDVISIMARWRYDLQDNRSIGTLAGVEYSSCCWRVQLLGQSYLTDESEIANSILFRFQLKGIGGFGADSSSMDQQIPGYEARENYFN